jgi:hypothetical protein
MSMKPPIAEGVPSVEANSFEGSFPRRRTEPLDAPRGDAAKRRRRLGGYAASVPRNVLVVTTVVADEAELGRKLRRLLDDGDVTFRIVAPATKLSRLDWLTGDEDRARGEAREAAERAAGAVADDAEVRIDTTSQDTDAAQAVDDALRTYSADEIVVVTRPGEDVNWLEDEAVRASFESFGVPVRHIELPER